MKIGISIAIVLCLCPTSSQSQGSRVVEKAQVAKEYRRLLAAFEEPEVSTTKDPAEGPYRLFVWPTFFHALSIRVEKSGRHHILVAKQLSGRVGYGSGRLLGVKRRRLTEAEWQRMLDLLNEASFWTLPFEEKEPEPDENGAVTVCLDGVAWLLEGVSDGQYHRVSRYCPQSESFKAVCLYIVGLSRIAAPWSRPRQK